MQMDVLLGEGHVRATEVEGRTVAVVDVLRAASSVAVAIRNGAAMVMPFVYPEEARAKAEAMGNEGVILAGERSMVRIPGFDLGNSPFEYTREKVKGKTILFSTTNGTAALHAAGSARATFFTALINVGATGSAMRGVGGDCVVICSGTHGRAALEDITCAGLLVRGMMRHVPDLQVGDGAVTALSVADRYAADISLLAHEAQHALRLCATGFQRDVAFCLGVDTVPQVVAYSDGSLVNPVTGARPV